jgi:hypothetical protein
MHVIEIDLIDAKPVLNERLQAFRVFSGVPSTPRFCTGGIGHDFVGK